MDARRALAAGALLTLMLLAGCSAAGSLDIQRTADDAELAEQLSRPTTDAANETIRHRQIARQAIENGSITVQSHRPLVDQGLPYASDQQYYNISWTVVARHPRTTVTLEIDYNGTVQNNATVALSNLSARDRALLDGVLPPRTDHRTDGYDIETSATYNASERNRSVLLMEEYDAVRYDGETYPVAVKETSSVTIKTYRYTASLVANSSVEYARQIREEYLFTLSGLSKSERSVVEQAINDTYYAKDVDDESFRSVMERFKQHKAVKETEYEGLWVVQYNGGVYVADFSYGGFDG